MAPVISILQRCPNVVTKLLVTAQHRSMLDQVLNLFDMRPDYDLDLMREAQTPTSIASAVMSHLEPILAEEAPDWVLVEGDTSTAMAASLAASLARAKVGHIEAGLRTHDKGQPFPEELNRRVTGVVADLHFAPTGKARMNLLRENVPPESVIVTGNPVIDALRTVCAMPATNRDTSLDDLPDKRLVVVTAHRRENFGRPLREICRAVREIAARHEERAHVAFIVHPNPQVQNTVRALLAGAEGVSLMPPLDYLPMVHLLRRCHLVLTDSGGIQEEAPGLGKPVLVLRNTTERPEAVEAGAAKLVGTEFETIVHEAGRLLTDDSVYSQMARRMSPFGDGHAAERIVNAIGRESGIPDLWAVADTVNREAGEEIEVRPRPVPRQAAQPA